MVEPLRPSQVAYLLTWTGQQLWAFVGLPFKLQIYTAEVSRPRCAIAEQVEALLVTTLAGYAKSLSRPNSCGIAPLNHPQDAANA